MPWHRDPDPGLPVGNPLQDQILYVAKHGNDANHGRNIEQPFLTFGAALTAAAALTPSATNRIAVACFDAGRYSENVNAPQWVSVFAPSAVVIGGVNCGGDNSITLHGIEVSAGTGLSHSAPGGASQANVHYILATGAAVGVLSSSDKAQFHVQSITVENDDAVRFAGGTDFDVFVGHIHITGTGNGLQTSAGSGSLRAVVGSITDTGSGTAIDATSPATVEAYVGRIACSVRWNITGPGSAQLHVSELGAGAETMTGALRLDSIDDLRIDAASIVRSLPAANALDQIFDTGAAASGTVRLRTADKAAGSDFLDHRTGDATAGPTGGMSWVCGLAGAGAGGSFNFSAGDGSTAGGNLNQTLGDGVTGNGGGYICGCGDSTNAQGGAYNITCGNGATLGGGFTAAGGAGVTGTQPCSITAGNCTGNGSTAGDAVHNAGSSTGQNGVAGNWTGLAGNATNTGGTGGNWNGNAGQGDSAAGNWGGAAGASASGTGGVWSAGGGAGATRGGNATLTAGSCTSAGPGGLAGLAGGGTANGLGGWCNLSAGSATVGTGGDWFGSAGTGSVANGQVYLRIGTNDTIILGDDAVTTWAAALDGYALVKDTAATAAEWRDVAATLLWGANSTFVTTAKRYLVPGGPHIAAPTTDSVRFKVPRAGTIRRMYVRHNTPLSASATNITYVVEKNGVATALTVTLAANATSGSDLANSFTVAAGDDLAVSFTKAGVLAGATANPIVSVEYA
jgi:hypothetical protein